MLLRNSRWQRTGVMEWGRRQYDALSHFSLNTTMEYVPKMSVLSPEGTLYLPAGHQRVLLLSMSPLTLVSCPSWVKPQRPALGNCLVPLVFLVFTSFIQLLAFVPKLSAVLTSTEWGHLTCPVPLICACANLAWPSFHCDAAYPVHRYQELNQNVHILDEWQVW